MDLDGPRIVHSSLVGPRSVELPVVPELSVEFSEPIDPATVHPGSVALVAWELLDERCELTPICDEGTCERGRCQADGLSSSQRSAIERGEFDAGEGVALDLELEAGEAGPDARLTLRPLAPLDEHRRYTLLIGPAVRDRSGAPLVDDWGRAVAWQREFVTAGIGSAGPEPRLVRPAAGQQGVATNLAWVETELWPPVPVVDSVTLELAAEDGSAAIVLVEPRTCPGWVAGTCLRWRPSAELRADLRYRPSGGSLVDRLGRGVVGPGSSRETWFRTGSGPDLDPPQAELGVTLRGRCLAVWVDAGEPVELALTAAGIERRASLEQAGYVGVELSELAPGDAIEWTLELRDLADNLASHVGGGGGDTGGALTAGASFDPALPRVRISEVLANPSGPEPSGEFVELLAGPDGAVLDGVWLSDLEFAEILAAWSSGDDPKGDLLPTVTLAPGELAVIAGSGWPEAEWAETLPSGVQPITSDASLGSGGLKNAGEALSLWTPTEQGPVLLASYGNWIDTGASAHDGRSVIAGPDGCDLPDRWRSHPLGIASPGALP